MSEDIKWKVGDRCQTDMEDGTIKVGAITLVETAQEVRTGWKYGKAETYSQTVIKSINVKWDDGEEQQGLEEWDVYPEDSDIERAFRLAVDDAQRRIDEKLAIASAALDEAVAISEETGVPFRAHISPLSQSYLPDSLTEKFPELDKSFANELAGAYGEYEGWEHSAVC